MTSRLSKLTFIDSVEGILEPLVSSENDSYFNEKREENLSNLIENNKFKFKSRLATDMRLLGLC